MSMQLHHTLMSQYKYGTASGIGSVSYESVANCVTPEIVIYGKCVQDGTPTPDVPIDIIPNNNVYSVNGSYYTIPTLYGVGNVRDEYYPQTGKVIRRCEAIKLTGNENIQNWPYVWKEKNGVIILDLLSQLVLRANAMSTHEKTFTINYEEEHSMWLGINSDDIYWVGILDALGITTVEEFKVWVKAQFDAGTPATLVYQLAEPVIEYVEPVQITSVRGTNVIEEVPPLNSELWGDPYVTGTQIDVKYLTHS